MFTRRLIKILTSLFVLGLVAFLILNSNLETVFIHLRILSLWDIAILVFLQLLTVILISIQWQLLFKVICVNISYLSVLKMNLYGTFFENITPAMKTGGEAFKLVYLKQCQVSYAESTPVLIMQKLLSLTAFAFILSLSLVGVMSRVLIDQLNMIILGLFLMILMLVSLLVIALFLLNKQTFFKRFSSFKERLKQALFTFKNNPKVLVNSWFIGVCIWVLFAFKLWIVLGIFNVQLHWGDSGYLTFIPYAVGLLPLSPGGLGTFEATMVHLMRGANIHHDLAMSITLVFRFFSQWLVFFLVMALLFIKPWFKRGVKRYAN